MKSKYETFDRSQLLIKPLGERKHDMGLDYVLKTGRAGAGILSSAIDGQWQSVCLPLGRKAPPAS